MSDNETLADVIADGRRCKSFPVPYAPARAIWLDDFNSFLDRIEAAYKRDIEKLNSVIQATVSRSDAEIDRLRREVAELRKQIGNAAKLREALDAALVLLEERQKLALCRNGFVQIKTKYCDLKDAIEKCRSVLSAPPRNCDVISNRDDAVRIFQAAFVEAAASHLHLTNAAYVKIIEPLGELLEIAIEVLYSTYHAEDSAAQNNESEVSHGNA